MHPHKKITQEPLWVLQPKCHTWEQEMPEELLDEVSPELNIDLPFLKEKVENSCVVNINIQSFQIP